MTNNPDGYPTYADWIALVPPAFISPLFAELLISTWKCIAPDIPFVEWLGSPIDIDDKETS